MVSMEDGWLAGWLARAKAGTFKGVLKLGGQGVGEEQQQSEPLCKTSIERRRMVSRWNV